MSKARLTLNESEKRKVRGVHAKKERAGALVAKCLSLQGSAGRAPRKEKIGIRRETA